MSTVKRFLSGSAASWAKILVTMVSQIALVPIFLSHWSVEQYGCWLVIMSITGLASLFSIGHQSFLEYEFLRVGEKSPQKLSLLFYSSIPYALLLSFIELVLVAVAILLGVFDSVFDADNTLDKNLMKEAFWALIVFSVTWMLTTSVGGLAGRLVSPFGYFPRFAWWGVALALSTALASVIAVYTGAGLLETALAVAAVNCIINIPIHMDLWRLCKLHQLNPVKPDFKLGATITLNSMALATGNLIDNLRQQGIRVFLSAIVGLSQMTAFSTTRTLSNVSLQGIGTVTNPVMPELMRYLRERDESRMNSVIGFLLFLTVILLAPTLVFIQLIIPDIFLLWTRGKIEFDAPLFGIFSISLLFYAIARPAFAIVQGNNLVKIQLVISTVVGLFAIGGVILMSKFYGIRGAASALLLAEILGCVLALVFAVRWLASKHMKLPWHLFYLSFTSILIAVLAIALMAVMPNLKTLIFICAFILCNIVMVLFIKKLPIIALEKLKAMIYKILGRKRVL